MRERRERTFLGCNDACTMNIMKEKKRFFLEQKPEVSSEWDFKRKRNEISLQAVTSFIFS